MTELGKTRTKKYFNKNQILQKEEQFNTKYCIMADTLSSNESKQETESKSLLKFGKNALKDVGSGVVSAGKAVENGVKGGMSKVSKKFESKAAIKETLKDVGSGIVSAGKVVGSGVKSGMSKVSKQFESKGEISMDLGEQKVYKQGDKLKGKTILNLVDDMEANRVTVTLQVSRMLTKGAGQEVTWHETYEISGERTYTTNEEIEFELIIPKITKKASSQTGDFLQTLGDAMQNRDISVPPMWSIYTEIHKPGGRILSMISNSYRLHVNDD